MYTFFWGYFSKPWKRLFRTLSILLILFFIVVWKKSDNWNDGLSFLGVITCFIPLLSYLIEPFVKNYREKNINTIKETNLVEINSSKKKKREDMTDDEIREKGRRFLDELQKKGPDLSKVGKTVVHLKGSSKTDNIDDEFDYPDKTREFIKIKNDIMKEFPRGNDSKKDNE
jgi:hypothetical protein